MIKPSGGGLFLEKCEEKFEQHRSHNFHWLAASLKKKGRKYLLQSHIINNFADTVKCRHAVESDMSGPKVSNWTVNWIAQTSEETLTEGQNYKLCCTTGEKILTKNISFTKGIIFKITCIVSVEFWWYYLWLND